jgi:hypothetical protein
MLTLNSETPSESIYLVSKIVHLTIISTPEQLNVDTPLGAILRYLDGEGLLRKQNEVAVDPETLFVQKGLRDEINNIVFGGRRGIHATPEQHEVAERLFKRLDSVISKSITAGVDLGKLY